MHYEIGQRGVDGSGVVCYVTRATRVKGIGYELYRYWVVDDQNGIPGDGSIRLPESFVGFNESPRSMPDREYAEQPLMPEFAHFAPGKKKVRRSA